MSMNRFLMTIIFVGFFALLCTTAWAEPVESHFFAPNLPSLGIYQQEFMTTYVNKNEELTKGYHYLVNYEFSNAIDCLNKVAHDEKADPKIRSEAYSFLGYAYLNIRDTVHCLEALKKSIEFNKDNVLAYYFLAHENFLNGDLKATEMYLKKSIEVHPKFLSAMRMLAELYKDMGQLKASEEYYKKIIEIYPSSGYFRYQYYKIALKLHNYKEAEQALKEMIKLQPKYRTNYLNLGEVYIFEGKLDEAMKEFTEIRKKNPHEARAYEGQARVFFERKEWSKAMDHAKLSLQLSPHNVYVKQLVADIKEQRDKETKENLKGLLIVLAFVAIGLALAYFILSHQRKKYVLSIIQNFNRSVDEIYDLDSLVNYLLSFFTDIGKSHRGMFMLFNRQNNELFVKECRGFENDEQVTFNLFAGEELTNWLSGTRRSIISIDEIGKDPLFEKVFPSLKNRIKTLGLKYLLPLREKNSLVGFIALDEFKSKSRILTQENDLLLPLSTTTAQALATLTLYEISVSDETTGVFNKRYYNQSLKLEVKRAERYKQPLSLVVLDVDDFGPLNERFGHAYGDFLLKELGVIIQKGIREGIDIGARTGGEEFSLILPSTEFDKAYAVAERLRKAVEDYDFPPAQDGSKAIVNISLGVSTFPDHAPREQELKEKAHEALNRAKKTGKNKVCMAEQAEEPGVVMDLKETTIIKRVEDVAPSLIDETGFYTRPYFDERYSGEVRRSERNSQPCSLILIKPDMELSETERLGVFKELADIFRSNLRRGIDVPARYDRDTNVILIPEADQHKAAKIARRMKLLVDKATLMAGEHRVTFSFGISNYPNLGRTEESFMEAARQALKMCQQSGGDRALIATPL